MDKLVNSFDSDNDPEEYTPIHSSFAYPIWQNAAREIAEKLEKINSVETKLLAAECRWYQETFARWSPRNHPTDSDRRRLIKEFEMLLKKANHYSTFGN